jgi:hypothetical protein
MANPFQHMFSGGNRSFNTVPNHNHASPHMVYGFNPHYNVNGVTGQWQPVTTTDAGALRVDIGTGVQISATVDGFSTLTGQVAQLQTAVNTLTGTVSSKWQKAKTPSYSSTFTAVSAPCLVNKILGYSKTVQPESFIQIFDSASTPSAGAVPDFVAATQTNNFYLDLAEAGVEFVNGVTIVNSSTADVYTPYGSPDFTASVVYKTI